MPRPRLRTAVLCLALGCIAAALSSSPAAPAGEPRIWPVTFSETGTRADPDEAVAIVQAVRAAPPTDVFIVSHGWLNDEAHAMASYEEYRSAMIEAAGSAVMPTGFRPLLVGVIWPSLSGDPEGYVVDRVEQQSKSLVREGLLRRLAPRVTGSDEERTGHLVKLARLLSNESRQGETPDTKGQIKQAVGMLKQHLQKNRDGDDEAKDIIPEEWADKLPSVRDALQNFTYWQMKVRAGRVGETGVRDLIREIQEQAPGARVHLIGHSFGCKVVVSALGDGLPKPIDTLVLLQGAVSTQLFADAVTGLQDGRPGKHQGVIRDHRVKGAVVATYSKHDTAVGGAYPVASRLAKHLGEHKVTAQDLGGLGVPNYRGIGAQGFDGVTAERITSRDLGADYAFQKGKLYSVDASQHVAAHSDVRHKHIAWLIWSAVTAP